MRFARWARWAAAAVGAAAVLTGLAPAAWGHADGIIGVSGQIPGVNCQGCHRPPAGATAPTLALAAPPSAMAGETLALTLTIEGGPGATMPTGVGGFDISASDGTLDPDLVDLGVRLQMYELTHTAPRPFAGGTVSWTFLWTAPATSGVQTLWAAGLSADGVLDAGGLPTVREDYYAPTIAMIDVVGGEVGPEPADDAGEPSQEPSEEIGAESIDAGVDGNVVLGGGGCRCRAVPFAGGPGWLGGLPIALALLTLAVRRGRPRTSPRS